MTLPWTPEGPTYADIEALPPHVVGEILAGELVVSPRPAPPHAQAASRLGMIVGPPFDLGKGGPGGWHIVDEPELQLGVDPKFSVVVPDLAGWRLQTLPERPETAAYTVVPDWVCEVLSPGTSARDRAQKLPFYGRAGVGHVWLVDPIDQTVEVYALSGHRWTLAQVAIGRRSLVAAPFEALEFDLGLLWGPEPPAVDPKPGI